MDTVLILCNWKCRREDDSSSSEFAEAQLTVLKKYWVVPDCHEEEYKILDAILPANWNYSDYLSWSCGTNFNWKQINRNLFLIVLTFEAMKSNESPSTESIYNNPANRIIAALTYTSQLVAVLAYFLDVRLPKNVCYR